MVDPATSTWDDVADELVTRLPRLRNGDAIAINMGSHFVQFKRFTDALGVIASSASPELPEDARLDAAQDRRMDQVGWPPTGDLPTRELPDVRLPVSADTARSVARLLVATLRDVYGATEPARTTFTSFNDAGYRAPTLNTIAMDPSQQPEPVVVPRTLLPDPSPTWRRVAEALTAGPETWTRPDIDRVFAGAGWRGRVDDDGSVEAIDGPLHIRASKTPEYMADEGFGDFAGISVQRELGAADPVTAFRRALAAVVAVLGDPPLVGGSPAFARWRRQHTTVTLARTRYTLHGGDIYLDIDPTEATENDEYRSAKWLEDWQPEYSWLTAPDVEAPEAKALEGMMLYDRQPAADLPALDDGLRALFGSIAEDLPLLYPYASSLRWRIVRPSGEWLTNGGFTRDAAWVRVGNGQVTRVALDGDRTGGVITGQVMALLADAGITSPEQLRGALWSDTPAERVIAGGLPLERW